MAHLRLGHWPSRRPARVLPSSGHPPSHRFGDARGGTDAESVAARRPAVQTRCPTPSATEFDPPPESSRRHLLVLGPDVRDDVPADQGARSRRQHGYRRPAAIHVAPVVVRAPTATRSAHLFDANIFYPEKNTLAFSDAMLVPSLTVAPLLWLGVHQLLVYNLLLLSGFALSGAAMFLLVRSLTQHTGAALVAGLRVRVPAVPLHALRASGAADGAVDAAVPVGVPPDRQPRGGCATAC